MHRHDAGCVGNLRYRSDIASKVVIEFVRMSLSTALQTASRRQVDSVIIAPRSRGQNDELGIGESCHRDPPLRWCGFIAATAAAPPRPCSRRGRIPKASRARNGHTTALFAAECQSFLDNVIAGLEQTG